MSSTTIGHYGCFSDNTKPLAVKVNQFFEDVDLTHVKGPQLGITPPWLVALPEVDRSLTLAVNKNEAPNILATLARDINRSSVQPTRTKIYSDASKDSPGIV